MASNKRLRSSEDCSTNVKEEISDDGVPIKDDAVGNLSGSSKAYPTEVKEEKSNDPVPIKDDAFGKAYSTTVKEEKSNDPVPIKDDAVVHVSRTMRDFPPADYQFQIKSFSLLSKLVEKRFELGDFDSGGRTWKLCLYPNGNKKENGKGHVSLYLAISNTHTRFYQGNVDVNFKLFVYDQLRHKYLTIEDANRRASNFNQLKTERGFAKLLSLDTFNDASNGFLVDDSCTFGVEVLVVTRSSSRRSDCLSVMKSPSNNTYTWKITEFSKLKRSWSSEAFSIGEHKGQIHVYPRGFLNEGNSLSIFLNVSKFLFRRRQKIYVEFTLRIKDQLHDKHHEMKFHHWFCDSSKSHGSHQILPLADLHDKLRGFIVEDTLVVGVQIDIMATCYE